MGRRLAWAGILTSPEDHQAEIDLVLPELNYEYLNSLAVVVTSQSHQYFVIAGGAELLNL